MENSMKPYISHLSDAVEYTGRWALTDECAIACACGSYFRMKFCGSGIILAFDISGCQKPFPHIYVSVDGGALCECVLDNYIRVWAGSDTVHEVTVTLKSSLETQDRWKNPVAAVTFTGAFGAVGAVIQSDTRPIIEFVGDSITEGNSVYPFITPFKDERWLENLVYTNDIASSYSYLTAELLGWRASFFGYGSTGVTCSGGGGVPRLAEAYGFIYDNVRYKGRADHVVINSGANDRGASAEHFVKCYEEAVCKIRECNPEARIWVVAPFCKAFKEELREFCIEYNEKGDDQLTFVDTEGWAPLEPLHPTYETNLSIAEKLSEIIKSAK